MPVLTMARDEVLRRARLAARVVLAKHPCVTGGAGERGGPPDFLDCDRILAAYQRQDVGRGQDAARAGGS